MAAQQAEVSAVIDTLAATLEDVLSSVTFEIPRFGAFDAAELRAMYSGKTPDDGFHIRGAKPVMSDGLRARIEDVLNAVLDRNLEEGHVGSGFSYLTPSPRVISLTDLADGAVRAAATLGPEQAARTVARWGKDGIIRHRWCAILSGLSVEQDMALDEELSLHALPGSLPDALEHLPVRMPIDFAPASFMGKLRVTMSCKAEPAFFPPSELKAGASGEAVARSWAQGPVPDDFAGVFCQALSLACNSHVDWMMQWSEFPEEEPFGLLSGRGYRSQQVAYPSVTSTPLSRETLDHALRLLLQMSTEGSLDRGLSLAIGRWVSSKGPRSLPDRLIDLRIALEALFIEERGGEIAFRLATRGAWYLGSDLEDRVRIHRELRRAYREASNVVHGNREDDQELQSVLEHAQDLCRRAILKRMDDPGKPDWEAIIMGSPPVNARNVV